VIVAVHGKPGGGKTWTCVKIITDDLLNGRVVVTNVKLRDGWSDELASAGWRRFTSRHRRARRAAKLRRLYLFVQNMDELLRVFHERPDRYPRSSENLCEGWWTVVLDEAHKWLNNREWKDERRQVYGSWFAEHRKLGCDVFLLSQHIDAIDKQVRDRVEYVVTLKNLKRLQVMGVSLIPWNLFLAVWVWADGSTPTKRAIAKRRLYGLDWRRALYDTFQLYGAVRRADAIEMPRPDTETAEALHCRAELL